MTEAYKIAYLAGWHAALEEALRLLRGVVQEKEGDENGERELCCV